MLHHIASTGSCCYRRLSVARVPPPSVKALRYTDFTGGFNPNEEFEAQEKERQIKLDQTRQNMLAELTQKLKELSERKEFGQAADVYSKLMRSDGNFVIHNLGITALAMTNRADKVLQTLQWMKLACHPTHETYVGIVWGFIVSGNPEMAAQILEEMITQRGFAPSYRVSCALVNAFCTNGQVEEAIQLFDDMIQVGLTSSSPWDDDVHPPDFIDTYCLYPVLSIVKCVLKRSGDYERALKLVQENWKPYVPVPLTVYHEIFNYCFSGDRDREVALKMARLAGNERDRSLFEKYLEKLVDENKFLEAERILEDQVWTRNLNLRRGLENSIVVGVRKMRATAWDVIRPRRRDEAGSFVMLINLQIARCLNEDNVDGALELYNELLLIDGVSPNEITYEHLIVMYASKLDDFQTALEFYNEAKSRGVRLTPAAYVALLEILGKYDKKDEACRVFESSVSALGMHLNCCNAMLRILFEMRESMKGVQLMKQMLESKAVSANSFTWGTVVGGLSKCRKLDQALDFFRQWVKSGQHLNKYGVSSLMCQLVWSNRLDDAFNLRNHSASVDDTRGLGFLLKALEEAKDDRAAIVRSLLKENDPQEED
eukprot:TRINITY_DN6150_c0_g1_i1.p1 TRINITY_DN6150_c0_g1~~TRINITY_DN6150_c0_g1_i1.p1  ORF type:complete len:600 (-),score=148.85 TRINITY_DN6150_c0_g1_i1:32-1831(-)